MITTEIVVVAYNDKPKSVKDFASSNPNAPTPFNLFPDFYGPPMEGAAETRLML
jgi:hypothetical protein